MLKHSEFTEWLLKQFPNTPNQNLMNIITKTSQGVAPEAADLNAIAAAEAIFSHMTSVQRIPIQPPPIHKYVLGQTSQNRLAALMPQLRTCVRRAIEVTVQDFTVLQTIRTPAEQAAAVKAGNSRTLHSRHLPQVDGFAHAVDLGAWVNGKVSWEFGLYADIAHAMDQAATEQGIANHVRWGCAWDRVLSDFGGSHQAYLDEAQAYAKRHAGSDLIDAPHFEWVP